MKKPVLVVMAAGLGSRYGGLKQLDPVGPHGQLIIDYSLYDARRAGFESVAFVVRPGAEGDFHAAIGRRVERCLEVHYCAQSLDDLPEGFAVPAGRSKPWGTCHAMLAARHVVDGPFAVINADDCYGPAAFRALYAHLTSGGDEREYAMAGYRLENTVTENGYVSRGVCQLENGLLQSITERTHIEKRDQGIAFTEDNGATWTPLAQDAVVSMNLWGFTPGFTAALEKDFRRFFQEDVPKNPEKAEFFLPFVVNDLLARNKAQVTVLSSADKWYGVTYKEDKETVMEAIRAMTEGGEYPAPLWK